jgi:cation diffusion facilitator CzcD-associated flavoprotein CzcO
MATVTALRPQTATEHVDVLIVGAGISGIGMAYYLQRDLPGKSYAILEGREAIGGTWDLFRYPGIRSDSDLHTYGYAFKPWTSEESIASGPAILDYIEETAAENGIDRQIRFGHHVERADWSTADARWTVTATRRDTGETVTLSCSWLFMASGYYRYDQGYLPQFPGAERFAGQVVHPQHWPEDLDYTGKRVVVIGSGATAVTLIPAMTDRAAHVTMLQRSPTYVVSLPEKDPVANLFKRLLPDRAAYRLNRRKNIWLQKTIYRLSQDRPEFVKRVIRRRLERALPPGYDIDTHFTPSYKPWDQRMCSVPDGDLFEAISGGQASVVTDQIETFTERGILLQSGRELPADIIVTATGLDLQLFGGAEIAVDVAPLVPHDHLAYKGFMLSDVPNLAFAFGYTNSSWTLKVDLVCEFLCRVLAHMDARGAASATPVNADPTMGTRPLLDFGAGYVQRAMDRFPVQGVAEPWTVTMAYAADVERLGGGVVDDGILRFGGVRQPPAVAA